MALDGNNNLYISTESWREIYEFSLATAEVQTAGQGVMLYPNPVSDVLTIATDKKVGQTRIYSADGRLVNTAENQKTLDVSALKSSVYFLNTEIGGAAVKAKFIKK